MPELEAEEQTGKDEEQAEEEAPDQASEMDPDLGNDDDDAKKKRGWVKGMARKNYAPKEKQERKKKIVRKWGVKPRRVNFFFHYILFIHSL
jgi:hypothetical protein